MRLPSSHCRFPDRQMRRKREARTLIATKLGASSKQHGSGAGTWSASLPDSPIPILQASFCSISLHTEIPPFCPRIVGRLS